jgi:hypothetical protein
MSDVDSLFMSAARLTLNAGNPTIKRLLDGANDEETTLLRRTLRWDVVRQMLILALSSDDVLAHDFDGSATSVAGVLRNLVSIVWPSEDPE